MTETPKSSAVRGVGSTDGLGFFRNDKMFFDLLLQLLERNPWPSSDPRWGYLEHWAKSRLVLFEKKPNAPLTGAATGDKDEQR